VHVSVKAGASSPFDFEEKWQHREWKCKRMRRKKHLSNVAFAESLNIFFWQRKNPTFIESPKGSTVQAAQYNHAEKKRVLGMLAYIQNQFQGSICRITQQFQGSICRSWKRARTHTMIHSVLRDWDVEDSKKDRKMKAWETEKECTYVCWRQW
jgi:hypothetical protein